VVTAKPVTGFKTSVQFKSKKKTSFQILSVLSTFYYHVETVNGQMCDVIKVDCVSHVNDKF